MAKQRLAWPSMSLYAPVASPSAAYVQEARLAQSVEHETLNLRVVGSSPTLGVCFFALAMTSRASQHRKETDKKHCARLLPLECPEHA